MTRPFRQVDVFTGTPYLGNPLAVVDDADGLTDEQMQRFASWTNLSETTFLVSPSEEEADYRVRIFTPVAELPFAGHPTLGSCHAWLEAGGQPRQPGVVIQECGVGLVSIRVGEDGSAFAAPPLVRSGPVEESVAGRVVAMLGVGRDEIVDMRWADNGPGWIAVLLSSADAVLNVRPGPARRPGRLRGARLLSCGGRHPRGPGDGQLQCLACPVAAGRRAGARALPGPPGNRAGAQRPGPHHPGRQRTGVGGRQRRHLRGWQRRAALRGARVTVILILWRGCHRSAPWAWVLAQSGPIR